MGKRGEETISKDNKICCMIDKGENCNKPFNCLEGSNVFSVLHVVDWTFSLVS